MEMPRLSSPELERFDLRGRRTLTEARALHCSTVERLVSREPTSTIADQVSPLCQATYPDRGAGVALFDGRTPL